MNKKKVSKNKSEALTKERERERCQLIAERAFEIFLASKETAGHVKDWERADMLYQALVTGHAVLVRRVKKGFRFSFVDRPGKKGKMKIGPYVQL